MLIDAYNENNLRQERIARRIAYHSSPVELQSKVTFDKFKRSYWPLADEVDENTGKTRRLLDRLKNEKDKVNGNGKT